MPPHGLQMPHRRWKPFLAAWPRLVPARMWGAIKCVRRHPTPPPGRISRPSRFSGTKRHSLGRRHATLTNRSSSIADGLVTMHVNELDVRQLLELLSRRSGVNILVSPKVAGTITANFEDTSR